LLNVEVLNRRSGFKGHCFGSGELLAGAREVYLSEPSTQLTEVSLLFCIVNSGLKIVYKQVDTPFVFTTYSGKLVEQLTS
jgi:hypothetical protein